MNKLQFCTILLVGGIFAALAIILILMIVRANGVKLKRKNTELLYREELFTKLSRNVDDIFMMLDIVSGKPDYVSPNIERLLGISVEEVLHDVHVLDKLHPEDILKQKVERLEEIQNEEQREWDFEYIHQKTRERRWFHIVAMRSEVEGRSKYIFVMSDRTEDKKVNQALEEAAHAAEAANRAKSTFLSNISHDIRTPMNAISGFTTLAIRSMDQKEKVRDYLVKIQVSGDHLMSLINDVLDMSRIESGRIHLEESEVKLPEVLRELETITSGHVQAKQLKLSVDAGEIANETVCCDKTRLNQILLNLLSNAIKFTPVGGRISVRLRQLPGTQENKTVCGIAVYEFRVKDNGIGMSPEFIKKIFDPFERERTSTVSRVPGTGLGMSISKNLVEMMGGTIEVQSEQGKGTEFMIRIPMRVCSGEK
ncbi:MAG: ATP-binding protein, partial [Bacillota bacterium]|nr:ATP-binding protein [Bacillota bacterium]